MARARPTNRGSSHVEPESGLKPRFDEGLPEHRVVGGHGEVRGQREVAAQADGPPPHGAHHGQVDGVDEFDQPVRRVRYAPHQIAGARALVARVRGDPVSAGAEIVAMAANVDGTQRVVGGGVGQRVDESIDHRMAQRVASGRAVQRQPQYRAVPVRGDRTVSRADALTHCRGLS